jgi:glucose-6-phosphate isomerase
VSQKPLNKEERLQIIEEKLKAMDDVKLTSTMKQSFKGGKIDFDFKNNNRRVLPDLQSQSRRPKALSKAYARMKEIKGDDWESQPYDNFLGAK